MISLLCPSRGRPKLAAKMAATAFATSKLPVEILFYLNDDDTVLEEYEVELGQIDIHIKAGSSYTATVGPDQPTAKSWNDLAKQARGDIIFIMGDDAVFATHDWDTKLKAATQGEEYFVVSMFDGRGDDSHPHPGISRKWYEALGYLAWPGFYHWYVDTWQVTLAKGLGRFVYCREVLVDHQKPAEQGAVDETHSRIRRGGINARDRDVWERSARYLKQDQLMLETRIHG